MPTTLDMQQATPGARAAAEIGLPDLLACISRVQSAWRAHQRDKLAIASYGTARAAMVARLAAAGIDWQPAAPLRLAQAARVLQRALQGWRLHRRSIAAATLVASWWRGHTARRGAVLRWISQGLLGPGPDRGTVLAHASLWQASPHTTALHGTAAVLHRWAAVWCRAGGLHMRVPSHLFEELACASSWLQDSRASQAANQQLLAAAQAAQPAEDLATRKACARAGAWMAAWACAAAVHTSLVFSTHIALLTATAKVSPHAELAKLDAGTAGNAAPALWAAVHEAAPPQLGAAVIGRHLLQGAASSPADSSLPVLAAMEHALAAAGQQLQTSLQNWPAAVSMQRAAACLQRDAAACFQLIWRAVSFARVAFAVAEPACAPLQLRSSDSSDSSAAVVVPSVNTLAQAGRRLLGTCPAAWQDGAAAHMASALALQLAPPVRVHNHKLRASLHSQAAASASAWWARSAPACVDAACRVLLRAGLQRIPAIAHVRAAAPAAWGQAVAVTCSEPSVFLTATHLSAHSNGEPVLWQETHASLLQSHASTVRTSVRCSGRCKCQRSGRAAPELRSAPPSAQQSMLAYAEQVSRLRAAPSKPASPLEPAQAHAQPAACDASALHDDQALNDALGDGYSQLYWQVCKPIGEPARVCCVPARWQASPLCACTGWFMHHLEAYRAIWGMVRAGGHRDTGALPELQVLVGKPSVLSVGFKRAGRPSALGDALARRISPWYSAAVLRYARHGQQAAGVASFAGTWSQILHRGAAQAAHMAPSPAQGAALLSGLEALKGRVPLQVSPAVLQRVQQDRRSSAWQPVRVVRCTSPAHLAAAYCRLGCVDTSGVARTAWAVAVRAAGWRATHSSVVARSPVPRYLLAVNAACLTAQRAWRGYATRMHWSHVLASNLVQRRAAVAIQRMWRTRMLFRRLSLTRATAWLRARVEAEGSRLLFVEADVALANARAGVGLRGSGDGVTTMASSTPAELRAAHATVAALQLGVQVARAATLLAPTDALLDQHAQPGVPYDTWAKLRQLRPWTRCTLAEHSSVVRMESSGSAGMRSVWVTPATRPRTWRGVRVGLSQWAVAGHAGEWEAQQAHVPRTLKAVGVADPWALAFARHVLAPLPAPRDTHLEHLDMCPVLSLGCQVSYCNAATAAALALEEAAAVDDAARPELELAAGKISWANSARSFVVIKCASAQEAALRAAMLCALTWYSPARSAAVALPPRAFLAGIAANGTPAAPADVLDTVLPSQWALAFATKFVHYAQQQQQQQQADRPVSSAGHDTAAAQAQVVVQRTSARRSVKRSHRSGRTTGVRVLPTLPVSAIRRALDLPPVRVRWESATHAPIAARTHARDAALQHFQTAGNHARHAQWGRGRRAASKPPCAQPSCGAIALQQQGGAATARGRLQSSYMDAPLLVPAAPMQPAPARSRSSTAGRQTAQIRSRRFGRTTTTSNTARNRWKHPGRSLKAPSVELEERGGPGIPLQLDYQLDTANSRCSTTLPRSARAASSASRPDPLGTTVSATAAAAEGTAFVSAARVLARHAAAMLG